MRRTDQRRAATVALYQADVTGRPAEELLDREAKPFTRELIGAVDPWGSSRALADLRPTRELQLRGPITRYC